MLNQFHNVPIKVLEAVTVHEAVIKTPGTRRPNMVPADP